MKSHEVTKIVLNARSMVDKWQKILKAAERCQGCCYLNQKCEEGCPSLEVLFKA